MGFFGSLFGFDQSMGAVNAVLASHLIENLGCDERIRIAKEVVSIIARGRQIRADLVLDDLSTQSRVTQMNFIALACDNLGIDPSVPNNVWTRVENPYQVGDQIDAERISGAIAAIAKQDGIRVSWPGEATKVNFTKMYNEGRLH